MALYTHIRRSFTYVLSRLLAGISGLSLFKRDYSRLPKYMDLTGQVVGPPPGSQPFDRIVLVSRHGLAERGVTCPACKAVAVKPGEWAKVLQTSWGDAVPCSTCQSMLLASPNDDEGDPEPGSPLFNAAVHHTFERPTGYKPPPKPRQRISAEPIREQDWVVVQAWERTLRGAQQDLAGSEGRVVELGTMVNSSAGLVSAAKVALGGNEGTGGNATLGGDLEWIPLIQLRRMILPSLRVGDTILVIKGEHTGHTGTITALSRGIRTGEVEVHLANSDPKVVTLPIERVEKIEPLEIFPLAPEEVTHG